MNEKQLLVVSTNVYPGYIKSNLTIGETIFPDHHDTGRLSYGYGKDIKNTMRGNLEPNTGYTEMVVTGSQLTCTKPFYYKGRLYTTTSKESTGLYSDWGSNVGKTVDVYIQKSGGGRKHLPLHACNSLWRIVA